MFSTKAYFKSQDCSGEGHKDTLKRGVEIFFVNEAACPACAGRALPAQQRPSPAVFPLAPLPKGRLCRSARPTLTRQHRGSERAERPGLPSIKAVLTLGGGVAGTSHVQGLAATMATLSLRGPLEM